MYKISEAQPQFRSPAHLQYPAYLQKEDDTTFEIFCLLGVYVHLQKEDDITFETLCLLGVCVQGAYILIIWSLMSLGSKECNHPKQQMIMLSYIFILSFAAILFIAHIWPPGRAETCKTGKAEKAYKVSPAYKASKKECKAYKASSPSLGKQYLAPQSLGPQVAPHLRSGEQIFTCNLISTENNNIFVCRRIFSWPSSSIAILRRPLSPSKAHSSSTLSSPDRGEVRGF